MRGFPPGIFVHFLHNKGGGDFPLYIWVRFDCSFFNQGSLFCLFVITPTSASAWEPPRLIKSVFTQQLNTPLVQTAYAPF